jgi:hypothetical protein
MSDNQSPVSTTEVGFDQGRVKESRTSLEISLGVIDLSYTWGILSTISDFKLAFPTHPDTQ